MAWYRCRHKGDGGVTPVGDATDGDVLSGKTYMNALGASTGTMPNRGAVSPSGLNCGGSYTIPAGYHNGSGKVTANSLASQTKVDSGKTAVTAGTMVSGYQGWVNGTKVTGTFTAQAGSASPSTSSQTKYPDSGKYFSSFTVSAISPQRSNGTYVDSTGIDSTAPYAHIPYGYYPSYSSNRAYVYFTAAQVQNFHKHTSTATPTGGDLNNSQYNLGEYHSYRYVNTKVCYDAGYSAGVHNGTDGFLQGLARNAFWFSINNSCGGDVTTTTVSGQNQVTINSINTGIVVVTNRNTGKFLNLLCKYNTYWRCIDDDAGSTQNSGLTYVDASQSGKFILRTASGVDNFFNVWIYNTY